MKWFLNVRLASENGFTVFKTEKDLPGSIWTEECSLCRKTVKGDFFIKCNKPTCEKYFHSKCIPNNCMEEIKVASINYFLCHCEEHKNAKKPTGIFSDVKTYGKNINFNSNMSITDVPSNIKVLKDMEESKIPHQDIILKTFKPVIINDEENKINRLKIRMKFTDETCSSNSSLNGIRTHSENLIQEGHLISHITNSHGFKSQEKSKLYSYFNTRLGHENMDQANIKQSRANPNLYRDRQYDDKIGKDFPGNFSNRNTKINDINKNNGRISQQNDEQDDEEEYEFVFSFAKCDICAKRIDVEEKEKIKQCNNCLTYYHSLCGKDFGDKLDSDVCRKCQTDKEFDDNCFVCGKFQGSMIKCDNSWVHVFCMVMLKGYFYKKHDLFNWGLEKYKVPKNPKTCQICNVNNTFTLKCSYCELIYHPYCGLKSNFDFYSVDKKVNGPTDLLNKLEISCICENHLIFLNFSSRISHKNKELNFSSSLANSNVTTAQSENKSNTYIRSKINIPLVKCKMRSLNMANTSYVNLIDSLNFKNLRKILNKFDFSFLAKQTEWNWSITDYFFHEIDEKLISCLELQSSENISQKDIIFKEIVEEYVILRENNTLKINQGSLKEKGNHIICEYRNKKDNKNYLGFYDSSKLSEIKLNSNYFNFVTDLTNLKESEHFSFLSKRKRPEELSKILQTNSNFILSKNLKLIEDDEENSGEATQVNKNGNSSDISSNVVNSTSSTKMKFIIEDSETVNDVKDNVYTENIDIDFDSEYKLTSSINSDKFNSSKFLKKLKLVSSFKLRRKDRQVLLCEEESKSKIYQMLKENRLSFNNLEDIDAEILIKNQMLSTILNKNRKILETARKNISSLRASNDNEEKIDRDTILDLGQSELMFKYRSIIKWGFIKRRLTLGVLPKSVEEILKTKGQMKTGKSVSLDKEDYSTYLRSSYDEIKLIESECCVCFFSEIEDTIPIVFCDSCNVSVHPLCYGIKEIPEGQYFCDLCEVKNKALSNKLNTGKEFEQNTIDNYRNKKCVLCLSKNGAMKRVDKSGESWAHVTCILLSSTLNFKDFLSMDEVIGFKCGFKTDTLSSNNSIVISCFICKNSTGDLFSCSKRDKCNRSFHFFCAYLNGLPIKIQEIENKKFYPIISCDLHVEDKTFKQCIQKELRALTYHKEFKPNVEIDKNISTCSKYVREKSRMGRNKQYKISPIKTEIISSNKFQKYKDQLLHNWEEIQINTTLEEENPTGLNDNSPSKLDNENLMDLDIEVEETFLKFTYPYDDSKCAVCLNEISENISSDMKYSEELLVTKCSKCGIKFHNNCYHMEALSINASRILCDYCKLTTRFKLPDKIGECIMCPNRGGALKKCRNKKSTKPQNSNQQFQWLHVICANFRKEIFLNNNCYEGLHNIAPELLDQYICELCNHTKGTVVKCSVRSCTGKFHSYCAMMKNLHKEKIEDNFVFYCNFHSKLFLDCVKREELDYNSILQRMRFVIKNNEDIKMNFLNYLKEINMDKNGFVENIFEDDSKFLSIIKNLLGKYIGEELFYNLLMIGI